MNFLAHAHLSGNDDALLLGNMIADAVKGSPEGRYDDQVARGIRLHRRIDEFTDKHPVVHNSVALLRPDVGRYAGVAVDICYDHFLARDWSRWSEISLEDYARSVYRVLALSFRILPARNKRILPWMVAQNWLVAYGSIPDLRRIFGGMHRRVNYRPGLDKAVDSLLIHYDALEHDFLSYYPALMDFVSELIEKKEPLI